MAPLHSQVLGAEYMAVGGECKGCADAARRWPDIREGLRVGGAGSFAGIILKPGCSV